LTKVGFDRSGAHLVVSTGKGEVIFLDPATLLTRQTLIAHSGPCFAFDFSVCGRFMATSGGEGLCALWDLTEMVCVQTFPCRESFARSVSLNHDASLVACACEDNMVDVVCNRFRFRGLLFVSHVDDGV
jgi:WD40 repeat protein